MLLKVKKIHESLKNIELSELPCWCFLITVFVIKGFDMEISSGISLFILGLFLLLSLPKILTERYSLKSIIIYGLISIIGIINFFFGHSEIFLFLAFTLIVSKGLNPKDILKLAFFILSACLIFNVFFSIVGIIENAPFEIYRQGSGIVKRFAFGFSHPNAFHLSFFICSTLYLILYYRKSNIFFIILLIALDLLVYYFTKSRTGLALSLLSFVSYYLIFRFKKIKDIFVFISPLILFFCILLPFLLGYTYGQLDIVDKLDNLLTGRIYYINFLLENFSFPLFGSTIYNNYVNFDNGFISLLYESGSIAFIIFIILLFETLFYMRKRNDYSLIFLLIFFAIYGITEAFFQSITSNICLFLFLFILNKNSSVLRVRYVKRDCSIS